jgi:hypothetical protein
MIHRKINTKMDMPSVRVITDNPVAKLERTIHGKLLREIPSHASHSAVIEKNQNVGSLSTSAE